jgi:hypothetical protein
MERRSVIGENEKTIWKSCSKNQSNTHKIAENARLKAVSDQALEAQGDMGL